MPRLIWSDRRRRHALVVAVVITAAGAIAAAAPSGVLAATAKTTGFVAETPSGFTALNVSRDGRQVSRAYVAYTLKCSDGATITDWDRFSGIPISSTGSFKSSYDTGPHPSTVTPGAVVEFIGQVTGKVNKKRTKVAGTARFAYAVKHADGTTLTCDTGTISYTAKD
jgi:hypothetical protein